MKCLAALQRVEKVTSRRPICQKREFLEVPWIDTAISIEAFDATAYDTRTALPKRLCRGWSGWSARHARGESRSSPPQAPVKHERDGG